MTSDSPALTSFRDPLAEKTAAGEAAIGLYINDPNMVELAAHMGFDWFMIDQMFTSHGWEKTEMLIRTAESVGITPVVRVQSYPWLGYDPHVLVDVSRNMGIGANYIMISNSGTEEIENAIPLAYDWHKKVSHIFPFNDYLAFGGGDGGGDDARDDGDETGASDAVRTQIIPQPESEGSLESVEEVMELPEVRYCFLALGDASQELTGEDRPDWNDPRIWEYIDRVVEIGERTDTVVGGNPSFHRTGTDFTYSLSVLEDRIVKLSDHGVKMIMAQAAPFYFQLASGQLLAGLEDRL